MTNAEVLDILGRLVDTLDNYLVYGDEPNPFPPTIRLNAMSHGLGDVKAQVLQLYTDLGGEDVWA